MIEEAKEELEKIRVLCQRSVSEGEFNHSHNEQLEKHCTVLRNNSHVDTWIPSLFELVEEFGEDVDLTLGSPGPIVHSIEETSPTYEQYLVASLARKPTGLSMWMTERIYRTPGKDSDFWIKELKSIIVHPNATPSAIEDSDWIEDL